MGIRWLGGKEIAAVPIVLTLRLIVPIVLA